MDEMDQNEELVRAWIGEKKQDQYYNRMKNGGFNLVAFFLSDLLMITRKMFLELIVLRLLVLLIFTVYAILNVQTELFTITSFVSSLIIGFTYYYIYRWSILRKIKKYQRRGLTYEEQLEIARKKGGDKITVGVILMFMIDVIWVILVILSVLLWIMISSIP